MNAVAVRFVTSRQRHSLAVSLTEISCRMISDEDYNETCVSRVRLECVTMSDDWHLNALDLWNDFVRMSSTAGQ